MYDSVICILKILLENGARAADVIPYFNVQTFPFDGYLHAYHTNNNQWPQLSSLALPWIDAESYPNIPWVNAMRTRLNDPTIGTRAAFDLAPPAEARLLSWSTYSGRDPNAPDDEDDEKKRDDDDNAKDGGHDLTVSSFIPLSSPAAPAATPNDHGTVTPVAAVAVASPATADDASK